MINFAGVGFFRFAKMNAYLLQFITQGIDQFAIGNLHKLLVRFAA